MELKLQFFGGRGSGGGKSGGDGGRTKDESWVRNNYDTMTVPLRDKYGDLTGEVHKGFKGKNDTLVSVEPSGDKFATYVGDTTRGFVAAVNGQTEEEAWKRARRILTTGR